MTAPMTDTPQTMARAMDRAMDQAGSHPADRAGEAGADGAPRLVLTQAIVEEATAEGLRLLTDDGVVLARRAASCLLTPGVGDVVLVTATAGRDAEGSAAPRFVLAVLIQRGGEAVVAFDRPARIEGATRMTLAARGGEVAVEGETVLLRGGTLRRCFGLIESVADRIESTARRIQSLAHTILRRSGREDVEAGALDVRVEEMHNVEARDMNWTARTVIRANAEQVHLG